MSLSNLFDVIVIQPIFNLLILLYSVVPGADFGVAIILLTIIIRFLLWPIVKRQLHQTKAMRKLQPELAKIRKKAKGNRQLEGMQMLELYKKHGVKPFRSILILLIQLPIFIALYRVIQIFTSHREQIADYTYNFLEGIPRIANLIADPTRFNEQLFGFIDLTQSAINENGISIALVILALAAAITQYISSKQTMPQQDTDKRLRDILAEAGEGKQPDQAEMNAVMMRKMIKFLPIMMFIIMLNLPGALALYYATSNIIAALQQYYILRKDTDELEAIAATASKQPAKKATAAKAKKATIVKDTPKKTENITRITASDTRKKKKE